MVTLRNAEKAFSDYDEGRARIQADEIQAQRKLVAAARMHVVRTAKQVRLMRYGHSIAVVVGTWRGRQIHIAR